MEIDAHHQPDEDKVDFPPDKISKHLGMVDIFKGLSIIQKSSINWRTFSGEVIHNLNCSPRSHGCG